MGWGTVRHITDTNVHGRRNQTFGLNAHLLPAGNEMAADYSRGTMTFVRIEFFGFKSTNKSFNYVRNVLVLYRNWTGTGESGNYHSKTCVLFVLIRDSEYSKQKKLCHSGIESNLSGPSISEPIGNYKLDSIAAKYSVHR